MVAFPRAPRLSLPLAPAGAALAFVLTAAVVAAMPERTFAGMVDLSGAPLLLKQARAPYGLEARALFSGGIGLFLGAIAWSALFLRVGDRRWHIGRLRPTAPIGVPTLRRADKHPDAPARAPLRASVDLSSPLEDTLVGVRSPLVEREVPRDLDLPLAAFDAAAIPDVPLEPVRLMPALATAEPLAPGERIETYSLTPEPPASIASLLDRLEKGARARSGAGFTPPPLEETLGSLRRLAARAR